MKQVALKIMSPISIVPPHLVLRTILTVGYTLAITNSSNPADAAAFYLPTIPLISGARPDCTYCMQHLFDIYYTFSSNTTLEISKNYLQAAQVMDLNCGMDFVSTSVDHDVSFANRLSTPHNTWVVLVGMIVWSILYLL